jgi:parallel beta-helix repeat protein
MKNIRHNLCLLAPMMALIFGLVSIMAFAQNYQPIAQNYQPMPLGISGQYSDDEFVETGPLPSTLSTYEDENYSFRIGYPQNWQAKKLDQNNMGLVLGMVPPGESLNNPLNYLLVQVEPLPATASLDQYTRGLVQTLMQSNPYLQILSAKPTTLGGRPAGELVVSVQKQFNSLMVLKVYAINEGIAYIITYNALAENYDYYLEMVWQVISSFEFIEAQMPLPEPGMKTGYPEDARELKETEETGEQAFISVGPSGFDYSSIQEAINASMAGDTIEVHGGSYGEKINVSKPLNLVGLNHPVVDSERILISEEGTLIQGFTLINSGDGIIVVSNNSIVKDNIVQGGDLGIAVVLSHNCTIDGNIVNNSSSAGIFVWGSSYNEIHGNEIRDGWDGLQIEKSDSNEIGNNTAIKCSHFGIYLNESSRNMISDNFAGKNQGAGIFIGRSADNTLADNVARDNEYGIFLFESEDNWIYGNVLVDNSELNAADTLNNGWDDGAEGNYYGNFECLDSVNGVCGTPYEIPGGSSVDRYPKAFEPSSFGRMQGQSQPIHWRDTAPT